MINDKKVLAIIPARGGSKRLPNKNILPLNGLPLIAWSINSAKESQYIDRVIVTTDAKDIANIAKKYGADIPFMRNKNLAQDQSNTIDVVIDVINKVQDFDIIIVLQPTSPLRTNTDIDAALSLLIEKKAEGIISVCPCEHPPQWSNMLPEDGSLKGFIKEEYNKRSQDLKPFYRLNGAIYIFTKERLLTNGFLINDKVFSFIMPNDRSVDIDTSVDFKIAEALSSIRT